MFINVREATQRRTILSLEDDNIFVTKVMIGAEKNVTHDYK
jgi:hypothetical protein